MGYIKKQKNSAVSSVLHSARVYLWLWLVPLATVVLGTGVWLFLALSGSARTQFSNLILRFPDLPVNLLPMVSLGLLMVSAALYFYFDYTLHARPFKNEKLGYAPLHHARVVVLPRFLYNWKQSLYWLSYGLASFAIFATVIASQVNPVYAYTPDEFVTTWKTDNSGVTASNQIRIPTVGGGYNYTVDWGDGNTTSGHTGDATHTYGTSGTYTVKITGTFPRIYFNNSGDKEKILSVEQWGTNQWTSMNAAFRRAEKLVVNAMDAPDLSNVTDMSYMFCGARLFNSNINHWDVSHVTSMNNLFANCNSTTIFNQPLNNWDVSNVTDMNSMFFGNNSFNQNINSWNTSNVTDMRNMFVGTSFNQPLNNWDVSNVTTMLQMFTGNSSFNQPLNNWNVANVTNMTDMFNSASAFNSSLANWNVSNVTTMSGMFDGAYNFNQPLNSWTTSNKLKNTSRMFYNVGFGNGPGAFNQPLTNWDVSGVTDMSNMFTYQRNFNGDLSTWNTSSVTNMSNMFSTTAFNQNINSWNVGNVTNMTSMFSQATAFNQPLNNWDVSNVTTMLQMFKGSSSFNQPLNNWNVSKVTNVHDMFSMATNFNSDISTWNTQSVTTMAYMFSGATAFNQPLNNWNVSNVTTMSSMFQGATAFNQPLNNWNVIKVTTTESMFQNASAFNRSLNNWNVSNVTTMRSMFQGATVFDSAVDDWDVSKVTNMYYMFELATSFNQPINSWNVGSVTNMKAMLADNPVFNQPLNNWNVSNVTNLEWMFSNSTAFNQSLNSWNTSKVTQLSGVFNGATSFNQPLNNWDTSKVLFTSSAFQDATAFNQSLGSWNIEQVYQMHNMLSSSGISYTNYDATLNGWAQQTPRTNVPFSAGNIKYCQAENARNHLINDFSWGIYDGGKYCGEPPVVSTGVADNITEDQATLHGTISDSETDLSATGFQWGKTTSYGNDTGNLGTNLGDIEAEIEPDECGTTYHYRAYATNLGGTTYGSDQTFATNACPPSFATGFITTWKTDNPGSTASNQVRLSFGTINGYEVDWGDGNTQSTSSSNPIHTYASPGTYTIRVMGDIRSFNANSTGNPAKLLTVEQWGDVEWRSMDFAFWNAANLQINAVDAPDLSRVTSLLNMFFNATSFNSDISQWDTSTITNMTGMFNGATSFNQSLNGWDTSNVINMNNMFILASSFNSDISQWDTSNVESMNTMFSNTPFNQPLNDWNTSKVRSMVGMFQNNTTFNQPLNDWDTTALEWSGNMFYYATSFNQPLNNWDTSKVTDMGWMFGGASSFNQPLDSWDTSSLTYTTYTFAGATSFNQSLSNWDMSNVTNMVSMFAGATSFNQSLASWDMQNVRWATVALNNTALSMENYDFTLAGWAAQDLQNDVYLGAAPTKYCYSADARQSIINDYNWTITDGGQDCPAAPDFTNAFITTWKTDNSGSSASNQITIPTSGSGYNYTIDWGDGNVEADLTGDTTHTYASEGTYTVKIIGNFPQIYFCGGGDVQKILTVEQWGTNQWGSMHCSFAYATNLTIPATDAPDLSNVTDMDLMFFGATSFNQPIKHWDTSNVESMAALFSNASSFNQSLDNWNVENVADMTQMFHEASAFNGGLSGWQTNSLTDMVAMFYQATSFNQPINNFNVSGVTDMQSVFYEATLFNQPLNNWDVSNVTNMEYTFYEAAAFNSDTSTWNTGNVTTMYRMFSHATAFNQPLNNWNVGNVTVMDKMFAGATAFNQPLDAWDTSQVGINDNMGGMKEMFNGATMFNQPLNNWNVSNVTGMGGMFLLATSFNQPLNNWDVSNVQAMWGMFYATPFNQPLNNWNTNSVLSMQSMFVGARQFNQPLNNWNTSSVMNMSGMFVGADAFNQSLAAWDVSNVEDMSMMFNKDPIGPAQPFNQLFPAGLSTANYDATLASWHQQDLQDDVVFDAGTSTYCNAEADRISIMTNFNWTINDSGKDCGNTFKQAHTLSPDKLSSTLARLKGSVSGTGAGNFVSAGFEWGETSAYGNTVNNLPISSNAFSTELILSCNKAYYYRAFAVDALNVKTYGDAVIFTLSCPLVTPPVTPKPSTSESSKAPTVTIVSPKAGQGYATGGDILLKADVTKGNKPVKAARFYINGKLIATITQAPYETTFKKATNGTYQLIVVVEDVDGVEVAADPLTFVVNKMGTSVVTLEELKKLDVSTLAERHNFVLHGAVANFAQSLPWIIVLLLVLFYAVQTLFQVQRRRALQACLLALQQAKDQIDGFVHIVTHYLTTPITIISLALEAVKDKQASGYQALKVSSDAFKGYVQHLVEDLGAKETAVKQKITGATSFKKLSIYRWVAIPGAAMSFLTVAGVAGAANLELWEVTRSTTIFHGAVLAASLLVAIASFELWQRQRELTHAVLLSEQVASSSLKDRNEFIGGTHTQLMRSITDFSTSGATLHEPTFTKSFAGGLRQLKKVGSAFSAVANILQSQQVASQPTTVAVGALLGSVRTTAKQKGIGLHVDAPETLQSTVYASDLGYICHVLLENALQFTKEGGRVTVVFRDSASRLSLMVRDTGVGIAPEKLNGLMQPFVRATSTETYDYEGLGLSLYTVRLLVERYGGAITMTSTPDVGTTVSVVFKK
ncbi:MAG: BspA family leucine-rich repeat surface protein [Candidatus Saccharimonadales bacterium]